MCNNFYPKLHHLWDNVEKCGIARQTTDDNIIWCRKDKDIGMSSNLGKNMDIHLYLILLLFHIGSGYAKAPECYVMYIACLVCGIILTFFWLDWADLGETFSSNACVTLHWNFYLIFHELQFFYVWWLQAHYVTIRIALIWSSCPFLFSTEDFNVSDLLKSYLIFYFLIIKAFGFSV